MATRVPGLPGGIDRGSACDLHVELDGAIHSLATGLHQAGDIVGDADGMDFLRRSGVVSCLGAGSTLAINDSGLIAGYAPGLLPVLLRGGKAIDLGRYPGGTVSAAYGINNAGQIVGEGKLVSGGPTQAQRWVAGPGQLPQVDLAGEHATGT